METLIFLVVFTIQFALSSGVLAGAILLAGDEALHKESILKCLGITLTAMLVGLLPFIGWLSIFVWLAGIMVAFEKEFLEAIIIAIACIVINILLGFVLGALVVAFGLGAAAVSGVIVL